ncbi:hypothetical protein MRX96_019240 [Rhipicephalus microplus]
MFKLQRYRLVIRRIYPSHGIRRQFVSPRFPRCPSELSWPEVGNAGFSPSGEDVATSAMCSVTLHFVVTGDNPGGDPTSECTTGGEGNQPERAPRISKL